MKLITAIIVASIVVSQQAESKPDGTDALLAQLRTAAKCDDKASVWRVWCVAADYTHGQVGELPTKNLVGLSIELKSGGDAGKALSDSVSLSVLAVDATGKLKLTNIKPTSKDEEQSSAEAVMALAVYFKGKAATAKLPKDLAGYVATLKGEYPSTKAKSEWTWQGATRSSIRKVGSAWVVIEHPDGGIIATILTDKWQ